jgi:hypothetical protein
MRCGWRRVRRNVQYAAFIAVVLATVPPAFSAQAGVCHSIRRGESATQAARRVTGDGLNAYKSWFQIRNASSKSVPKSQYSRVRAGWLACVPAPAVQAAVQTGTALETIATPSNAVLVAEADVPAAFQSLAASATLAAPGAPAGGILRALGGIELTMVWVAAGVVLAVPWFGWRMLDGYLIRRKTASIVMRHYADRFVEEFERPLIRDQVDRPVRSQVRFRTRRGRFDILLAPGKGRRYPNLSDHKKNVEYDVIRVVHALGDRSFESGQLYTHDEWVVVPLQFKAGPKQSGVPCISSL